MSDIKPGDFVGSGGVRGTDGQIHAVEVRPFPESMRGGGEGQRPWEVSPEDVMTNTTAGTVLQMTDGGIVHLVLQGQRVRICGRTGCPGAAYVLADRTLLKTGAAIVTTAVKQPDGSLPTSPVTSEKDGIKPPM